MSDRVPDSDDARRIAELRRINAELSAELRDLRLGRASAPRPSQLVAARRVARLEAERDSLSTERTTLAAELEATQAELRGVEAVRDDLLRHKAEQEAEIARLRGGFTGLLRRGLARLRRS